MCKLETGCCVILEYIAGRKTQTNDTTVLILSFITLQSPTESEHESDDELDFDDARSHSPSPSAQSTGSRESGGVCCVKHLAKYMRNNISRRSLEQLFSFKKITIMKYLYLVLPNLLHRFSSSCRIVTFNIDTQLCSNAIRHMNDNYKSNTITLKSY